MGDEHAAKVKPAPGKGTGFRKATDAENAEVILPHSPAPVNSNPFLDAALAYAERGWRVHPCKPRAKTPLLKDWPGKASTDADTITAWWQQWPAANVAIATGGGLLVLDLDGEAGQASANGRHLPVTPCARTGGGGVHYLYRDPHQHRNAAGLLPGVDVRGEGGYIIAPPGIHPSGAPYTWAEGLSPEEIDLAACPDWLAELLTPPRADTTPTTAPAPPASATSAYGKAALDAEAIAVADTALGERNDRLNKAAFAVGQLVAGGEITKADAEAVLLNAATACGLERAEAQKTIRSGMTSGAADPRSAPEKAGDDDEPQAEVLYRLAKADADLFRDYSDERFVTLPVGKHLETYPLLERGGGGLRDWLARRFREERGRTPNATALQTALVGLVAEAGIAPVRQVALRAAATNHGNTLWLDLADEQRRAVKIAADGWSLTTDLPAALRFRRPAGLRALSEPSRDGGGFDRLRALLGNVAEEDFILVVAWMVAALRPAVPCPVLVLVGEQGSAKSTTAKILRYLLDPIGEDGAGMTRPPKDDRDLFAVVNSLHVLAIDNVSSLDSDVSDSLSAIATGAGLQQRRLYTDSDMTACYAMRPLLLNGIGAGASDIASRPDLLDRTLTALCKPMRDERRAEKDLWPEVREAAPAILGELCTAMATALQRLPKVHLPVLPRMADFAEWIVAAEPSLPWPAGTFMDVYAENRQDAVEQLLDADPVAIHLRSLAADGFVGTTTQILDGIEELASDAEKKRRRWPGSVAVLGKHLTRIRPALEQSGVIITTQTTRGRRLYVLDLAG